MKCHECEFFENRCYVQPEMTVSVCNRLHEVVDPEDTCHKRHMYYHAHLRRGGRNPRLECIRCHDKEEYR